MSAFVVTAFHINALIGWASSSKVDYFWSGRWRSVRAEPARCAAVLYAQNVRSVNARYAESDPAHGFPYRAVPAALHAVHVIKACHCMAYQCDQTDDYEQTEAAAIVRAIEASAVAMLPGYADAPWALEEPQHATAARRAA